ncbi:MAG TPA: hypothetical protein PLD25_30550 [Chloroflexota bacterium]|nr:hypothetical protein [Chloroflexota bacterium]HUM68028.1 hypothetical protein [Chloroflexota bacterium]
MERLILIQDRLSMVVAVSTWLLTLYWMVRVVRLKNRFVFLGFSYFLAFAIGMTFEVRAVYLWFDGLVGAQNLSWLIAWLGITTSAYLITCTFYMVQEKQVPLWLHVIMVTVLTVYFLSFWAGIWFMPERPAHVIPRGFHEFVFMQTLFIFVGLLFVLTSRNVAHVYRNETALIARVGWGRLWVMTMVAICFFGTRIVLTFWAYWQPTSGSIKHLYALSIFFLVLPAFIIPILHLPNWMTLRLAKPFLLMDKWWTLRQLIVLQSRISEFCSPIVLPQVGWREALKAPDFHIYRSLIGILDGKSMLEAYLASLELLPGQSNKWPIYRFQDNPQQWDEPKKNGALALFFRLQPVSDEMEIPDLARAYRRVGGRL